MKCNKKNCPLAGNNENCDIRDCKWRTETAELKRGEVNAVKEYEDAIFQLEHNKINLGEYEALIEPLKHLYAVEPCKDAISREYALGVIYPSNIYPSRADIFKALKDAPSVTVEPKHGKWIHRSYYRASTGMYDCEIYICNRCRNEYSYDAETGRSADSYHFCPNCGARMKGANNESI